MKRLLLLLATTLLACSTSTELTAPVPLSTPVRATETPIPSPTLDTAATHAVLEQAALDAQLTNVAFENLHIGATVQAAQLTAQADGWTVTAAVMADEYFKATGTAQQTTVPLTQTSMAIVQTQVAQNGTAMVMTWAAPSQIVAMANAEAEAKYADEYKAAQVFALVSLSLAALVFGLYLVRRWSVEVDSASLAGVTDFTIKTGGAYPSSMTYTIPCTGAQMDELADGVIRKHKSLAHGQWEGRNSETFTRESIEVMRRFMTAHKMAKNYPGHEVKITDYGEQVLRGWLDTRTLPRHLFLDLLSNDGTGNLSHKSEELPLEGGLL